MRRRRNYTRRPGRRRPIRQATGHTFLIVVEGEATEIEYLEGVRSRLKRRTAAVLVRHGEHTDPVGIVRDAINRRMGRLPELPSLPLYNRTTRYGYCLIAKTRVIRAENRSRMRLNWQKQMAFGSPCQFRALSSGCSCITNIRRSHSTVARRSGKH